MSEEQIEFLLEPDNNLQLAAFAGPLDAHLRQIERATGVEISNRGNHFSLSGDADKLNAVQNLMQELYDECVEDGLSPERIHLALMSFEQKKTAGQNDDPVTIRTKRGLIRGRGGNQNRYLRNIQSGDINFGIGPAGTGKTYLAVACAVQALEEDRVRRILLVRPAVEAGERLGFLPGDLEQKINPYLRPLYDALYEMLGFEKVAKLVERNVIEVAPLAYMRGRTLNESFVILDEAQNTTVEQMKMFLTRIGFGSVAVITGDVTQIDLPRGMGSGLKHAMQVLKGVDGIAFTRFEARDVVRHPLVQRIVRAYDAYELKAQQDHPKRES